MQKEAIVEKFALACQNNMGGIFDIIRDEGFVFLRSDNKTIPKMAVFYQNGIRNKIINVSAYLPYEISILLLEYMITYYLRHQEDDIYITIDDFYTFDPEITEIVDAINEKLENKLGKLLTETCKYM